ncbi:MAG: methylated-DNA-protein-cysteine methyltransferase related protein [Patescibacteria group bacterium]|nr:methylated-DNA-protein-cysteine methyltransferase related protein [Patescibacteria group bacterium]
MISNLKFKNNVLKIVSKIPRGRVMTYGQIAAVCGHPRSARAVGQIAHFGDTNLPWHRVVNAQGKMANGYVPNGPKAQANFLIKEGIKVKDLKINLENYIWWP